MMNDSLKDWPRTLRVNVIAGQLAQAICYARAEVYGGMQHWDAIPPESKRVFVEIAEKLLRDMAPVVKPSSAASIRLVRP